MNIPHAFGARTNCNVGSNGQRFWDSEMEQEANWLGAALIGSRDGRLNLARGGRRRSKSRFTMESANPSVLWRLGQTGIYQQLERTRLVWLVCRSPRNCQTMCLFSDASIVILSMTGVSSMNTGLLFLRCDLFVDFLGRIDQSIPGRYDH